MEICFQNGNFKFLLDATIAYEDENSASLFAWWMGASQRVRTYWRVIKITPGLTEDELRDELFAIWREKEELLKYFKTHKEFPKRNNNVNNGKT